MRRLEQGAAIVYDRWLDGDNRLTRLLVRRRLRSSRSLRRR